MPKFLEPLVENCARQNVELRAQAFVLRNSYAALRRDLAQHVWHVFLLLGLMSLLALNVKRPHDLPIWITLTPYAWWLAALWVVAETSLIAGELRRRAGRQAQDWLAVLPIATRSRVQARVSFTALRALLRAFAISLLALASLATMPEGLRSAWWEPLICALALLLLIDCGVLLREFRVQRIADAFADSRPKNPRLARSAGRASGRQAEPLLLWWRSQQMPMARFAWWWLLPGLLFPLGESMLSLTGLVLLILALLRGFAAMGATQRTLCQVSALLSPFPWTPAALYRASWRLVAGGLAAPMILLVLGLSAFSAPLWLLLLAGLSASAWVTLHLHCAYRYRRTPRRFEIAFLLHSVLLMSLTQALPPLAPLCLLAQCFWLYDQGAKWP